MEVTADAEAKKGPCGFDPVVCVLTKATICEGGEGTEFENGFVKVDCCRRLCSLLPLELTPSAGTRKKRENKEAPLLENMILD